MVFSPDLGGKNGGVLSMRMQVILDSPFARPGSAPMWGGKKGEFRDWTIDEVDQIQRKKVATIIGHVFQLTYAAFFDKLVQEEKVNRCHGCVIQHPSQRQHSCLMLDTEDAWFYYHDEAREQIDLAVVMKTAESVFSTLGLKLGQTWESYLTELPKLPWTSLYLTSLELEHHV